MNTRHTITAIRTGHTDGMDWEVEYMITYGYVRRTMHPADLADPGWPAEVEYISHEPVSDYAPAAEEEVDWCRCWLIENATECIDIAEAQLQSS